MIFQEQRFQERKHVSDAFESILMHKLNSSGWIARRFGQSQLPEECRARLKRFQDGSGRPCLIRWMPDIITFRDLDNGRSLVALIDAKAASKTSPNYSIEMSAIETAEIYTDRLYTPTFFVFDDWKVMTPREARQRGTKGPEVNNGSGTPYLLINKRFSKPMADIFHT